MYALVVYCEDGVHHICSVTPRSSIWRCNTIRNVKWINGTSYPAKVVCTHASKEFLKKLSASMKGTLRSVISLKNYKLPCVTNDDPSKPTPSPQYEIKDKNSTTMELDFDFEEDTDFTAADVNISLEMINVTDEAQVESISDDCVVDGNVADTSYETFHVSNNVQYGSVVTNDNVTDDNSIVAADATLVSEVNSDTVILHCDDFNATLDDAVYELLPCDSDTLEYCEVNNTPVCIQLSNVIPPDESAVVNVVGDTLNLSKVHDETIDNISVATNVEENVSVSDISQTSVVDVATPRSMESIGNTQRVPLPPINRIESSSPLTVPVIPGATGRKTRRYFCIYCKEMFANLPQHLQHLHRNEAAVLSFLKLPAGSKDRKRILKNIRRRGDFEHNTSKEYNNGTMLVARRPRVETSTTSKILTCPECNGQFFKSNIRRHYKSCSTKVIPGQRNTISLANAVYQDMHPKASHNLRNRVFPVLRNDDCVTILRYDELGICIANNFCKTYSDQHFDDMIRAKIRLMGRFLLTARELDATITDMASVISPLKYDVAVQAINLVAGLNVEGTHYRAPTVATTLSTLLKNAANIWKVECLKKRDIDRKKDAEDFLSLLTVCNTAEVNRTAIENRVERQRQKIVRLPSKSDICKLVSYVRHKRRESYKALSNLAQGEGDCITFTLWNSLATYTLISLLVFNRRRPGELERITIKDYASLQGVDGLIKDYEKLSSKEKNASRTYKRFEIRGKLNRPVPVLVHWEIELCLDLIIKYREQVGVPAQNPYIFGLPSNDSNRQRYLRACPLIRNISTKCGATEPLLLRVTILRKQIATECAIMDLNENIIKDVANFMGHAENIHNKIYRLPVETRDIVRMSNVLEIIQGDANGSGSSSEEDAEDEEAASSISKSTSQVSPQLPSSPDETCCSSDLDGFDANEMVLLKEGKNVNRRRSGGQRFCGPKRSWSGEEKEAVMLEFGNYLELKKLPSYRDVQTAIQKHPSLSARSPTSVRLWIENQIIKKRKSCELPVTNLNERVIRRIRWSNEELHTLNTQFAAHIKGKTLPSQREIQSAIDKYPHLQQRSVKCIKTAVLNARNRYQFGLCRKQL